MSRFHGGLAATLFVFSGLLEGTLPAQNASPLNDEEFGKILSEVNTPLDKPWRQVPWKISLLEAQNQAARAGKPIFIWAMDGHPLGCT